MCPATDRCAGFFVFVKGMATDGYLKFFGGVADGRALGFGIDNDAIGHVEIGRFVHEDVTVAGSGFDSSVAFACGPRK